MPNQYIAFRRSDKNFFKKKTSLLIGIVVDAVSEVLNISEEDIEETPMFGTRLDIDYILGMAKMEGSVKIFLDIDKVLSSKEIERLETAG